MKEEEEVFFFFFRISAKVVQSDVQNDRGNVQAFGLNAERSRGSESLLTRQQQHTGLRKLQNFPQRVCACVWNIKAQRGCEHQLHMQLKNPRRYITPPRVVMKSGVSDALQNTHTHTHAL